MNSINQKKYVGKSNNIKVRWNDHKKIALGGKEKYPTEFFAVHAAIAKYGIENFKIEILEEFDNEDDAYSAETKWIELLNSNNKNYGYNCNAGGKGGIRPTEETIAKLVAAQNTSEAQERRSRLMKQRHLDNPGFLSSVHKGNQYTKGHQLTQEHKDKISKAGKGRKMSDEFRKKISELNTGEKHPRVKLNEIQVLEIRQKHIPGKYGYVKLAKEYGVHDETIRSIILRKTWRHI
jgi:group I intron endonuclease